MSCNHTKAIKAMQKAGEVRAMKKLLYVLLNNHPSAVTAAWDKVNLVGHRCHICRKGSLGPMPGAEAGSIVCNSCKTPFHK